MYFIIVLDGDPCKKKNHSSSAKEWPSAEGKAVKLILNSTRHVQPLQTQELPVCIPQLTPVCRKWKFRSLFQAHHQGRLALFSLCSQLTPGEKNCQGSLREDHCPGPACELCPCICQPGVTGARTGSSDHPLWRPEVAVQQDEGLALVPLLVPGEATSPAPELVPSPPGTSLSRPSCEKGKRGRRPAAGRSSLTAHWKPGSAWRTPPAQRSSWPLSQG